MRDVYEVEVEDRNGDLHTAHVIIDDYIPYLPATNWEPEQREDVDWFFCDEKGKFIEVDFEISDRQIRKIDEYLMSRLFRDGEMEP